jgi:hypothetical protein
LEPDAFVRRVPIAVESLRDLQKCERMALRESGPFAELDNPLERILSRDLLQMIPSVAEREVCRYERLGD